MKPISGKLRLMFAIFVAAACSGAAARDRHDRYAERGMYQDRDNGRRDAGTERGEAFRGRRGEDERGDAAAQHYGRMSPDERRALREQINQAGRDLYSPRR
ncbi:MAG: hypothetical protein ACTHKB_00875 [Burkholderiaceae bacterium]